MQSLFRFIVKLLLATAAVLLVAAVALWLYFHPRPPSSQAFVNGNIITLAEADGVPQRAEAVLIEGDKIVALGTTEAITARLSWHSTLHDLQGKTLLPGFVEAHGHFPGSGLDAAAVDLNSPPIGDLRSIAKLLDRLRARQASDGEQAKNWLVGFGYDDTVLAERRHPTRAELDAVSASRPIYLVHISGHMGVANSAALAAMSVSRNTPVPAGGEIARSDSGELTGLLTENAHKPFMQRAYQFSPLTQLAVIRDSVIDYAKQGVTTVQNGLALKAHLRGLALASKLGLISQRLVQWPEGKLALAAARGELDLARFDNRDFSAKRLVGAAKLIADGSIQGYTGFLSAPYFITGGRAADYRGFLSMADAQLREAMRVLHCENSGQLAVHGNGDAAIDAILDSWQITTEACPQAQRASDPRLVLIHAQMARDDQLQRMRQLGVTPSFFNSHVYYWGDRHRDIFLGPERASRISPLASADRLGLRYSLHLDTPVVPINPLLAVWSAANRLTSSGAVLGAEQVISVERALRAVTIDAAWQMQLEDRIGSIEPGKLADFVLLSADPLAEGVDLRAIRPLETWVGGVRIYGAD